MVPVVKAAVAYGARVSIDTTKLEVAARALDAGASLVNHVGAQASDALLALVAERDAGLVLMHNVGRGEAASPETPPAVLARVVRGALLREADRALSLGVRSDRLWLDPGIGFAKTAAQSIGLLGCLSSLVSTGYPILVGASRKSFIAEIARALAGVGGARPAPGERLGGSIAAAIAAMEAGARALRVHDVGATRQALAVHAAIRHGAGR